MFRVSKFAAAFAACLVIFIVNVEAGVEGYWEGEVSYKGDNLPLRLEIQNNGGVLSAKLDLPTLVYAGQPVAIEKTAEDQIKIAFPFGIGDITGKLKAGEITAAQDGVALMLRNGTPPPYSTKDISFGAFSPKIEGTLYIPVGEGPFPVVVLLAGSGGGNRAKWSYASWADFYARQGVAAFIYDRRGEMQTLEDGGIMTSEDHARDVADVIETLKTHPELDPQKIGAASHSRGGWIAMALGSQVPDLAFMIFLSPAPVTPAEQTIDSNLTGMDQDGLSTKELEGARNYLRLYFYVAQTLEGWDLLEANIQKAQETTWGQYLDQPRNLDDLRWWHANMNFDAARFLRNLKMPVLAFWGGADFITPYAQYEGVFRQNLEKGGNDDITTMVFADADHRIEINPRTDADGSWHWFGVAPGVLELIKDWIKKKTN